MREVVLNSVTKELSSGCRPKGGVGDLLQGIPSLGAEHLNSNGGFNFKKVKFVSENFYNENPKSHLQTEDILIVKDGATTGKVSYVDKQFPYDKASINEHLFYLRVNTDIAWPKYIFHCLHSEKGKQQILTDFRGATVGGISRLFINKVKIPLPPLPEQKRIAAILDKADEIKRKREEAIKLCDEFLKSVFLEMFGDPVTNPMGWEKRAFGEIIENIQNGYSAVCESRPAQISEWGVLKLSSISQGYFIEEENKAILQGLSIIKSLEIEEGDLLFSRKNTHALVGACALINQARGKLLIPDLMFRLIFRPEFDYLKPYFWALLQITNFKSVVQSLASGSAGSMPNISKTNLRQLKCPIPDEQLIKKFNLIQRKNQRIKQIVNLSNFELLDIYQSINGTLFR